MIPFISDCCARRLYQNSHRILMVFMEFQFWWSINDLLHIPVIFCEFIISSSCLEPFFFDNRPIWNNNWDSSPSTWRPTRWVVCLQKGHDVGTSRQWRDEPKNELWKLKKKKIEGSWGLSGTLFWPLKEGELQFHAPNGAFVAFFWWSIW